MQKIFGTQDLMMDARLGGLMGEAVPELPRRCPFDPCSALPDLLNLKGNLERVVIGCVGVLSAAGSTAGSGNRAYSAGGPV